MEPIEVEKLEVLRLAVQAAPEKGYGEDTRIARIEETFRRMMKLLKE